MEEDSALQDQQCTLPGHALHKRLNALLSFDEGQMSDLERYDIGVSAPSRNDRNYDTSHLTTADDIKHLWIAYIPSNPKGPYYDPNVGQLPPLVFNYFDCVPTKEIAWLRVKEPPNEDGYQTLYDTKLPNRQTHYAMARPTRGFPGSFDKEIILFDPVTPSACNTFQQYFNPWFTVEEYNTCSTMPSGP